MTHDELLLKIDDEMEYNLNQGGVETGLAKALCAVVELHKPNERATTQSNFTGEWVPLIHCHDCHSAYPCPTIQAIKKELG